jgi:hypothetical protein
MKIEITQDSKTGTMELSIDAYGKLSKESFAKMLESFPEVKLIKNPSIFSGNEFCLFEFQDAEFSVYEDSDDFWFNCRSSESNAETIKRLGKLIEDFELEELPNKNRYWLIVLLMFGLALSLLVLFKDAI